MRVFLIILDGCPSYQINQKNTPFLWKMKENGLYFSNCKTIFPSVTYACHTTIITGRYPNEHGMIGNLFFDRKKQKISNYDNFNDLRDAVKSETIFKLLEPIETAAICEPIPIDAKHVTPFFSIYRKELHLHNLIVYNETLRHMNNSQINFFCLNFTGVDGYGEQFGPDSNEFLNEMKKVDNFISKIYENTNEAIFFIVADHGMVNIKEYIDMNDIIKKFNDKIIVAPSHRMCHVYCDEKDVKDLKIFLKNLDYIDKIFDQNDIKKLNLFHERSGNITFSAKEGFEFGVKGLKGSHGGFLDIEMNVPLLIFSKNLKVSFKHNLKKVSIIDIVPTILSLFNVGLEPSLLGTILVNLS
ncbi:MAG: alkaline phosphatase family protein [Candidatus Lokiarchaeota archaeon]|nr:alkaline phosphatase family protein [Candidatus Lokiarchaeota archaeon]